MKNVDLGCFLTLRLIQVWKNYLYSDGKELLFLVFSSERSSKSLQVPQHLAHLPLLEGLPCQVAPTGSLEHGEILLGLLIPLLLQLSQAAGPEKQLE